MMFSLTYFAQYSGLVTGSKFSLMTLENADRDPLRLCVTLREVTFSGEKECEVFYRSLVCQFQALTRLGIIKFTEQVFLCHVLCDTRQCADGVAFAFVVP